MSLLSVVKRASVLLNLDPPASVLTGGKIVRQLAEFARIDAEDLAQRHDWTELEGDHSFQTVAAEAQSGGLPADFLRFAYGGGIWNRSRNQMLCDLSREGWQAIKAGGLGGIYGRTIMRGGKLNIVPAPAAGETIAYPYISSKLYADAKGTPKATWDADTDVCRLPENVVAFGAVWRWRQAKGFAYGEDMATYERALALVVPAGPTIVIGRPVSDGIPYAWPGVLGPTA